MTYGNKQPETWNIPLTITIRELVVSPAVASIEVTGARR